jgi:tetratricopeptide (TPR) repeat protein
MSKHTRLATHLRSSSRIIVYAMAFCLPLIFLPWTLDALEINKQTFFVLAVCAAALCWLGSMMAEKTIRLQRGWSNILPLLIMAAFIIPAMGSMAPYISWVGSNNQEYTSVLTAIAGAVLIYVVANTFTTRKTHRIMHTVFLASSTLVALLGALSLFGASLFPEPLDQIIGFNTVGTVNTFAVFLIVMSMFSLAVWISHKKNDTLLHKGTIGTIEQVLAVMLSLLTLLVVLVIDYSMLWILLIAGLSLILVFGFYQTKEITNTNRFWLPVILLVVSLPFWLWLPRPMEANLPFEITLNQEVSLEIANRSLESTSSVYGTGPGTYQFDYTQFRDASINESDLWESLFDRGASHVLTLLPTIGHLGLMFLAAFCLMLLARAGKQILRPGKPSEHLESFVHTTPWVILVLSAFLYTWNMTLIALFFMLSALVVSQLVRTPAKRSFAKYPLVSLLLSFLFLAAVLVFFIGIFVTSQRYAAEVAYTKAIEIDQQNGDLQEVVVYLDKAASLNQYHDTYYRNLSSALLLRTQEQLEGVSSVDTLTASSQQYLQSLVAASINAAAHATELSPNNVRNWLTRGMVYREIAMLDQSASEFAIEAYLQAVRLEPANPSNWTELGKAYLVHAQLIEPLTVSDDLAAAEEAEFQYKLALQNAESAFSQAVVLKSNYAPAHYQLGITYELQGLVDAAIGKLESVAAYNALDVGVQFQLGVLYLQRSTAGDTERAQSVLERAVTLMPSYSNARWFLATVYEIKGETGAAISQVEAVLELNPGNELVLSRLNRLYRGELEEELPEAIEETEEIIEEIPPTE